MEDIKTPQMNQKKHKYIWILVSVAALLSLVAAAIGTNIYNHIDYKNTSPLPTGSVANLKTTKTVSYPGRIFTILYPSSWNKAIQTSAISDPNDAENMESKIIAFMPPDAPISLDGMHLKVYVRVYKSTVL
jgi:hypothetical protein